MTAKEYLKQAYKIDQRINSKLEQLSSLRSLVMKVTTTLSDGVFNKTRDVHSREYAISKIIDMEHELNADVDMIVDLKSEIIALIKKVEDTELQTVLELRYLCFKNWKQISDEMGYSVQHIFRLHEKALEIIEISKSGEFM